MTGGSLGTQRKGPHVLVCRIETDVQALEQTRCRAGGGGASGGEIEDEDILFQRTYGRRVADGVVIRHEAQQDLPGGQGDIADSRVGLDHVDGGNILADVDIRPVDKERLGPARGGPHGIRLPSLDRFVVVADIEEVPGIERDITDNGILLNQGDARNFARRARQRFYRAAR